MYDVVKAWVPVGFDMDSGSWIWSQMDIVVKALGIAP